MPVGNEECENLPSMNTMDLQFAPILGLEVFRNMMYIQQLELHFTQFVCLRL